MRAAFALFASVAIGCGPSAEEHYLTLQRILAAEEKALETLDAPADLAWERCVAGECLLRTGFHPLQVKTTTRQLELDTHRIADEAKRGGAIVGAFGKTPDYSNYAARIEAAKKVAERVLGVIEGFLAKAEAQVTAEYAAIQAAYRATPEYAAWKAQKDLVDRARRAVKEVAAKLPR